MTATPTQHCLSLEMITREATQVLAQRLYQGDVRSVRALRAGMACCSHDDGERWLLLSWRGAYVEQRFQAEALGFSLDKFSHEVVEPAVALLIVHTAEKATA